MPGESMTMAPAVGKNTSRVKAARMAEEAANHFEQNPGKLFIPRSASALNVGSTIAYDGSMEEAFPDVDPGLEPFGSMVLVLLRQPKMRSAGEIIMVTDARQTEHYNTQIAKVIALGPIAFHNRNTGEAWPEGAWAKIGDFVRVPKYGGDRWTMTYARPDSKIDPDTGKRTEFMAEDEVTFALFKDLDLRGRFTGDPLKVRVYL